MNDLRRYQIVGEICDELRVNEIRKNWGDKHIKTKLILSLMIAFIPGLISYFFYDKLGLWSYLFIILPYIIPILVARSCEKKVVNNLKLAYPQISFFIKNFDNRWLDLRRILFVFLAIEHEENGQILFNSDFIKKYKCVAESKKDMNLATAIMNNKGFSFVLSLLLITFDNILAKQDPKILMLIFVIELILVLSLSAYLDFFSLLNRESQANIKERIYFLDNFELFRNDILLNEDGEV